MIAQDYWNQIGSKKVFEDPLYIEKLAPFLSLGSKILEYGCGYGRMMKILKDNGYDQLIGYDYSEKMIARGAIENPDLDLRLLEKSGVIPEETASFDAAFMSTVLCCMVDQSETHQLAEEIFRILKTYGILYITDFLICDHPYFEEKYAKGLEEFGERGVYKTTENLAVRHYTSQMIMDLLQPFDVLWFEQFDFKTMNQNPARTFHAIARKR